MSKRIHNLFFVFFSVLVLTILSSCITSPSSTDSEPEPQFPYGTEVPYGRVIAFPEDFDGENVRFQVRFLGIGEGGFMGSSMAGHTLIRVYDPLLPELPSGLSAQFTYAQIPDAQMEPLFTMVPGTLFEVIAGTQPQYYAPTIVVTEVLLIDGAE